MKETGELLVVNGQTQPQFLCNYNCITRVKHLEEEYPTSMEEKPFSYIIATGASTTKFDFHKILEITTY